jgi:hypothetical protein
MKKEGMDYYLKSQAGIPLVLDSYEDIFSNFDPRPYSNKALSGDFLLECKKASAEKKGKIRIRFFLAKNKRNPLEEIKIKKRLKEHFNKHFIEKRREIRKIKLNGLFWTVIGSAMMIMSVFLLNLPSSFLLHLLMTLVQPAGWFFLWEGMGKILLTPKEKEPDYNFYKKMAGAEFSFMNH